MTFFQDVSQYVAAYNRQIMIKDLGFKQDLGDIPLLLLDCYSTIRDEIKRIENIETEKLDKQWQKQKHSK